MLVSFRIDGKTGKLPDQKEADEALKLVKRLKIVNSYFDKLEIGIERPDPHPDVPEKIIFMTFTYENHYATGRLIDVCELKVQLAVQRGIIGGLFSINDYVWNEGGNIFEMKNVCGTGPKYESIDMLGTILNKAQEMGCLNPKFRYEWPKFDAFKTLTQIGLKRSEG